MSSEVTSSYGDPGTRKRILDAAWDLIGERGSAMRVAGVAERAGVSRQAVYLHFRDRSGLLVALVDHIDTSLGSAEIREHVFGADTGVESLRRWVETMGWYTAKIDRVTEVLEKGQYEDEGLRAAWRDRMNRRQDFLENRILRRIDDEGRLAPGWSVQTAAELIYAITMPAPWRELTRELGWTPEDYTKQMWALIEHAVVVAAG